MNRFSVFCIVLSLILVTGCAPATAETPLSPTTESAPATDAPATEAEAPTSEPIITVGWSSTASTGTLLSYEHPGTWIGPAQLPFGEGVYVKDPDQDLGMIIQQGLAGDPASLLAAFGTAPIEIIGVLNFTPEMGEDASALTISRLEVPTKIAEGGGLTARAAYMTHNNSTMEILMYAPSDQWEDQQETFNRILSSMELWKKYTGEGLMTVILHDWAPATTPPEGSGIWFHDVDTPAGMTLWFGDIGDPAALTAAWSADRLSVYGLTDCTSPEAGERLDGLGGQWDAVSGECTDATGVPVYYRASYLANRDRTLETVLIWPTEAIMENVFDTMLSLLTDIR